MLDERGVEWTFGDGTVSYASNGHWCHAWAYNDGAVCVSMGYFTPEQAIEATIGRTCHDTYTRFDAWTCSECGENIKYGFQPRTGEYCRGCGAKVVE